MNDFGQGPVVELGIEGIGQARRIGEGGFGVVYRARQEAFGRTVAVKVLRAPAMDEEARGRFERECRAVGSLSGHPHIVSVYASGVATSGQPYLVMEHLPGGTLAERLARAPLDADEVADIGVKLAGALAAAHAAGVLHRDLKPENVLVSAYGEPQVVDFGVARIQGGTATRSGLITGSLAHAAPEVLSGLRATEASDVYSLSSTLYALLAGHAPFVRPHEESFQALLTRILSLDPPPRLPPRVPSDLVAVLADGLAKDPETRVPTAEAFAARLQETQDATGARPTPFLPPPLPEPKFPVPAFPAPRLPRARAPEPLRPEPLRPEPLRPPRLAPRLGAGQEAFSPEAPVGRGPAGPRPLTVSLGDWVRPEPAASPPPVHPPIAERMRSRTGVLAGTGAVVLALVVVVAAIALTGDPGAKEEVVAAEVTTTTGPEPPSTTLPPVTTVSTVAGDGSVTSRAAPATTARPSAGGSPATPAPTPTPPPTPAPLPPSLRSEVITTGRACEGSGGQLCTPRNRHQVTTSGVLSLRYTASAQSCSTITLHVFLDGAELGVSPPVGAAQTVGFESDPVPPGTHLLELQAEGVPGGCNTGSLLSWGGSLTIVTSA